MYRSLRNSEQDAGLWSCKLQYLVHWAGYEGTNKETSWLLASELGHPLEVISDIHQVYLEKP